MLTESRDSRKIHTTDTESPKGAKGRQKMKNATIKNVNTFRGFDVVNGQVDISTDEYIEMLDEVYEEVTICGMAYSAGTALEAVDPVAFRCGLGDYESEIQAELEDAIENEDYSDIDWIEELEDDEE